VVSVKDGQLHMAFFKDGQLHMASFKDGQLHMASLYVNSGIFKIKYNKFSIPLF
jgi:hypothetical protein